VWVTFTENCLKNLSENRKYWESVLDRPDDTPTFVKPDDEVLLRDPFDFSAQHKKSSQRNPARLRQGSFLGIRVGGGIGGFGSGVGTGGGEGGASLSPNRGGPGIGLNIRRKSMALFGNPNPQPILAATARSESVSKDYPSTSLLPALPTRQNSVTANASSGSTGSYGFKPSPPKSLAPQLAVCIAPLKEDNHKDNEDDKKMSELSAVSTSSRRVAGYIKGEKMRDTLIPANPRRGWLLSRFSK
jgi:hypothetical protein